jgi:WD40 repeat protein
MKKLKSPIVLFLGVFLAISVVTVLVNKRSHLKQELHFPLNNGVAELSTHSHYLVAISQDAKLYIWDWQNLSNKSKTGEADSDQTMLLSPDTVLSVKRIHPDAIVIKNLTDQMNRKTIPLTGENSRTRIGSNRNKSMVVILLEKPEGADGMLSKYEVLSADWQNLRCEHIAEIIAHKTSRLSDPVVSDDGQYILLIGQKEKQGWMVLVNANDKTVVWDKQITDFERFESADFSPDGKYIYARGCNSILYKIQTGSGDFAAQWPATDKNKSTLGQTSVQKVKVSPDGRIVASIVGESLVMWDSQTGKKILQRVPKHKIESGLAFSPDGRFVATSDLRQGGTIKIWRCPKIR